MPEDLFGQISRAWAGFRKKTADLVARQEAAFARGKIAGTPVHDDEGNLLVDAGHRIDDTVIERAAAVGKLRALAVSAGTAQMQDWREKARETLDRTPDGLEARSLESVDDFIEARRCVGRIAGVDVTDVRGNVVVPAGREIQEQDVQVAREAGLLSALIYSAQQPAPTASPSPQPPSPARPAAARTWFGEGPPPDTEPAPETAAPSSEEAVARPRPRLPLVRPRDR